MSIHEAIQAYQGDAVGEHHRYRSWEHCYGYFRQARPRGLAAERDQAALQLAFYLASWGMYRGSSFLLQHAYTVHRNVIDLVADPCFDALWDTDLGANLTDTRFVPRVRELILGVRAAYKPFAPAIGSSQPTDTLITKVVLGTFGCLPAVDRYFVDGLKSEGIKYSSLTDELVRLLLDFCQAHLAELQAEQAGIERSGGVRYSAMKLVDMYFWQIGYEKAANKASSDATKEN